jgi:hypothetical protein
VPELAAAIAPNKELPVFGVKPAPKSAPVDGAAFPWGNSSDGADDFGASPNIGPADAAPNRPPVGGGVPVPGNRFPAAGCAPVPENRFPAGGMVLSSALLSVLTISPGSSGTFGTNGSLDPNSTAFGYGANRSIFGGANGVGLAAAGVAVTAGGG